MKSKKRDHDLDDLTPDCDGVVCTDVNMVVECGCKPKRSTVSDVLIGTGICKSRSEVKRLIKQGGVYILTPKKTERNEIRD